MGLSCTLVLLLLMPACAGSLGGFSRGQRLQLCGAVLDVAGHPEIGEPVRRLGKGLERAAAAGKRRGTAPGKQPLAPVQPASRAAEAGTSCATSKEAREVVP